MHEGIVAAFGRKAMEAALAAGATMDQALEAEEKAAVEAETTLLATSAMREYGTGRKNQVPKHQKQGGC